MKTFQVNVDNSAAVGRIRKINGGNLGPVMISDYHPDADISGEFAALNIPLTRLHDAPYENPGRRLVDIPQIFPDMEADPEDPANYFFDHTDDYIQTILDCGTQIMYRLGVSIEHGKKRYFLSPPKDVKKYAAVCANIIRHMNEGKWNGHRFNIRYWEIWNEPENWDWKDGKRDLPKQWDGTLEEFNEFYCRLAKELKALFPELMIGGPSHGGPMKNGPDFLACCKRNGAPVDFYSGHCYSDSVEEYRQLIFDIRKMMDDAGFPDAELHLNEWHYHPVWPDEYWFNKTLLEQRLWQTEYYRESKGLDSAAMLCAVLSAWQDAPIDMGGYYTTGGPGGYGIYEGVYLPTPSYYGLKAFGEIVRFPERVKCGSEAPVYALAGKNGAGEHALLVSVYRGGTGSGRMEITFDAPVELRQAELLDETHSLEKVCVESGGKSLSVNYKGNSGVCLIKYTVKQ